MTFLKKHRRALLLIIAACILAGAGTLYFLKTSTSAFAAGFRAKAGDYLSHMSFPRRPELSEVLSATGTTVYVDGALGTMPDKHRSHDVKLISDTPGGKLFCDFTTGFSVTLPADTTADLSHTPALVTFESAGAKVVISKEWSYDPDVSHYIEYYFYRFLLDESYRAENDITLLENSATDDVRCLTVRLNGYTGTYDTYTYLDFMTGSRFFFHVLLKYSSQSDDGATLPQRVLDSFSYFAPEGTAHTAAAYHPVLPEDWTAETRSVYEQIATSDSLTWGIFTKDVMGAGIEREIPDLEKALGHQFGIVLAYTGLGSGFPTEFMDRCYAEGRLVELTLQTTDSNNLNLFGHSPWLTLYKTGDDARIRAFARAARDFGMPFLFRLNNEMNSDWVSYGGVVNLLDPDIFIENWRTVYRIFQEEDVTNAIWIFNPNDRDAPPNNWNFQSAYYPGDGYAQLFGVTGYNNGTYYQKVTGESWRSFETIYDKIAEDAGTLFGAYPWIITEFSSSSIGGDKARWIDGMFENLDKYPNIKAAVWFSYADYDPKDDVTVSRPYWLDETDETLLAFKRGLDALAAD